jgi:Icc-related predicted phosphoesterase
MKICAISDTHCLHNQLDIPECDILIHSGDSTEKGKLNEVQNFELWFSSLEQAKYKIYIAGNHDYYYQKKNILPEKKDYTRGPVWYLRDNHVTIDGLKIYGTPWTPFFCDWAFNGLEDRGDLGMGYAGGPGWNAKPDSDHPLLSEVYNKIPEDTDILICHGPPRLGSLDKTREGIYVGSWELRKRLDKINTKIVITGHIHEGYGSERLIDTFVYNVSSCNRDYKIANPVTIINL